MRIWQPELGRLVRIVRGHEGAVLAVAFTENHIASGSADGKVRLIDRESDAVLKVLEGHTEWVVGLAASESGLVSADWSGRALLWRDEGPRELR